MGQDVFVFGTLRFPPRALAGWLRAPIETAVHRWPEGFDAPSRWPADTVQGVLDGVRSRAEHGLVWLSTHGRDARLAAVLDASDLVSLRRALATAFFVGAAHGAEGRFGVLSPWDAPTHGWDAAIVAGGTPTLRAVSKSAIARLLATPAVAPLHARMRRTVDALTVPATAVGDPHTDRVRARLAELAPTDVHEAARALGLWAIRAVQPREKTAALARTTALVELFPEPADLHAAYVDRARQARIDAAWRLELERTAWLVVARLDPAFVRRAVQAARDESAKDCAPAAGEALAVCGTATDLDALLAWVRASAPPDAHARPNLQVDARTVAYVGGPAPALHRAAATHAARLLSELGQVVGAEPFAEIDYPRATYAQWLANALLHARCVDAAPLLEALERGHPDRALRHALASARHVG